MPQKGQKSVTVNEETFKTLERVAEEEGKSISGMVSWLADNAQTLRLVLSIKEETLKAHLLEALKHTDWFVSFCKSLTTEEQGSLIKTHYLTFERLFMWYFKDTRNGKYLSKNLSVIMEQSLTERKKLIAILRRMGEDREPGTSFPLIPLQKTKSGAFSTLSALFTLLSLVRGYFGSGEVFRKTANNLEFFVKTIPELQLTISNLNEIADWLACFEEDLHCAIKNSLHKKDKKTESDSTSSQNP